MENSRKFFGEKSQTHLPKTFTPSFRKVAKPADVTNESAIPQAGNIFSQTVVYIRNDTFFTLAFLTTGTLFLYFVLLVVATFMKLPPVLPLFYSMPWGEEQLIATPFFMLLPLLSVAVFVVNTALSMALQKTQPILSHLLFLITPLFALLLAITATKIIFLVVR